jgi:CheY-like chemotaxis protein
LKHFAGKNFAILKSQELPPMSLLALVIDDSMLLRHMLGRFLEKQGFTVETAGDGAEALEILKTLRPHVIFTDLKMPRLNGYQLIEILNASAELSRIPLVVFAAKPLPEKPPTACAHMICKDFNVETQLTSVLQDLFPDLPIQRNASDASAENSAEAKSCASHLG